MLVSGGPGNTPHRDQSSLLELPRDAIVFYRLQKDRGGFADGKDHNVKGECCALTPRRCILIFSTSF